jgi:hypothetical protein
MKRISADRGRNKKGLAPRWLVGRSPPPLSAVASRVPVVLSSAEPSDRVKDLDYLFRDKAQAVHSVFQAYRAFS